MSVKKKQKVDHSYHVVSMLAHSGLVQYPSNYFIRSPLLAGYADLLRLNMINHYISGSVGLMTAENLSLSLVAKIWRQIAEHGFFARQGAVMNHFVREECRFWREVFQDPTMMQS